MDSIIAISEQSKTPLIQARVDAHKIDVILNCVDLSLFQSAPGPAHSGKYVVGIVGRIEPFKCQKAFVEIASKVAAQCKKVQFRVIGAALDTPVHRTYEREVRQLVAKYQLQDIIHFTGHRTDMPTAMQELDLLVTLSAGSVIAEAMAAGKPVIGTPIGSTADMIVHGVTGYVIPLDPMEKIVDKIIELAENPIQSMRIGQAARKHAEETFGIEAYVQKVQDIYERLFRDI
jgi:glycosyltransferase involved in cell wall biosynthesis